MDPIKHGSSDIKGILKHLEKEEKKERSAIWLKQHFVHRDGARKVSKPNADEAKKGEVDESKG